MTKKQSTGATAQNLRSETPFGAFYQDLYTGQPQQFAAANFAGNPAVQGVQLCFDLYQEGNKIIVEVPAPGLDHHSLQVLHEDRCLRLRGVVAPKSSEQLSGTTKVSKRTYFLSEIPTGIFDQLIILPCEVDPATSRATFSDGILRIEMEKTQSETEIPVHWVQ